MSLFLDAQNILESFIPTPAQKSHHVGLARMKEMLLRMDNPERAFPSVHVGGTAGKGSTATMIANILQSAGYKVGLHLSPHVIDIRERMQINSQFMTEDQFISYVNHIKPIADEMAKSSEYGSPSYFEILATISFLYFQDQKVDIAIIEVGLGGRIDGTNVITPLVSVLTNVSLDHTEILGGTVELIAQDKVGIFKDNIPVVTGVTQPSIVKIVEKQAKQTKSQVFRLGKNFSYHLLRQTDKDHMQFRYISDGHETINYTLGLMGEHQVKNACLAIATSQLLRTHNYHISDEAIHSALRAVHFVGRFERVGQNPSIIFDGAHNPAKVQALKDTLVSQFPNKKIRFVFAAKQAKNVAEMITILTPIAKQFYFTKFQFTTDVGKDVGSNPVSFQRMTTAPLTLIPDAKKALTTATEQAADTDIICITGSLYLVGQLRPLLYNQNNK